MAVAAQAKAPNIEPTIAELKKRYGDRVSTAHAVREQHGKDISFHEAHLPDAVVFAESAEEVQQIVQICARHKTPIIAFGTGGLYAMFTMTTGVGLYTRLTGRWNPELGQLRLGP